MYALQIFFEQYPILLPIVGLVLGLLVGSFLNVVIYRLPLLLDYSWSKDSSEHLGLKFDKEKPNGLVFDRSFCPSCKSQIAAWYNIPLLGFILLKGRCHNCKEKISWRYPAVELLTGVLTAVIVYKYGYSLQTVAFIILTWILIVIALIDLDTFLIPDQLSLGLLWLGLFFSLYHVNVSPDQAIVGAIVGYLILWSIFQAFLLLTKKEGMGYGDFKLFAAGGAWLGFMGLLPVLIISSVSGLFFALLLAVIGKKANKIPFGPYLAIGIWLSVVFEKQLTNFLLPPL